MDRTVPYDEDAVCDRCGRKGAHDFMGDCYCDDCLITDEEGYVMVKPGVPDAGSGQGQDG